MFSHAVHLGNVGTAGQQCLVDALFFFQAQAIGRQGQQGRAAARNQAQHQVIFGQPLRQRQNALGCRQACGIGYRMRGLDHFNALGQTRRTRWRVAIARNHEATQRRIRRPQRFNRLRHGTTRFARAQHQGAATAFFAGRGWQKGGCVVQRQGALYSGSVQVFKEFARLVCCARCRAGGRASCRARGRRVGRGGAVRRGAGRAHFSCLQPALCRPATLLQAWGGLHRQSCLTFSQVPGAQRPRCEDAFFL